MRRTFASQAEFDTWHEQAKTATGMPIVGVNARTGEPQPDKQQTTDYTSLGRDEDGNLILEAVVGDERLVARGLTDDLVRAGLFTTTELGELAKAYPAWAKGERVKGNEIRAYDGKLWRATKDHETNVEPPNATDWDEPPTTT